MTRDHRRIWLEPGEGDADTGRAWCQDNVWGDEATEYVRADRMTPARSSPMPVGIPISRARAELADLIERLDRSANSAPWSVCGPPWGNGTAVFTGTGDPHGQRLICDCDDLGACYDDADPLYQADDTDNARLIVALRNGLPTILKALREPSADDAYAERNKLVAALARLYPSGTKRTAIEGWDPEWHGCVYIDLPTGQCSWHYNDREADLFADLPPYAGEWDGHSTEEKYRRLAALREPEREPDEAAVERFVEEYRANTGANGDDLDASIAAGRVDLPGGWSLVRDDEQTSPHHMDWFLSSPDPNGIWVAKFWDGPDAGASDVRNFAMSLTTGEAREAGIAFPLRLTPPNPPRTEDA